MQSKKTLLFLSLTVVSCAMLTELVKGGDHMSWAAESQGPGQAKPLFSQSIQPLFGTSGKDSSSKAPSLEDLNQCPGTVQHYRLPPTGYVPPEETKASKEGAKLYEQMNCASCHTVRGKGGMLGPPLDGIGGHRGRQWLEARLLNPETQMKEFPDVFGGRPNLMPHPGVSRRQASQIADYLLTLPEPEGGFLITAHPTIDEGVPSKDSSTGKLADKITSGRDSFSERGCAMCHSINTDGGRFGPSLDGVSRKYSREALVLMLTGKARGDTMKTVTQGISVDEAERITDFLYSLKPTKPRPGDAVN